MGTPCGVTGADLVHDIGRHGMPMAEIDPGFPMASYIFAIPSTKIIGRTFRSLVYSFLEASLIESNQHVSLNEHAYQSRQQARPRFVKLDCERCRTGRRV